MQPISNHQQENIQAAASKLLEMFQSGSFPEVATRAIIQKAYGNKPCRKWSFGNFIIMLLSGTCDARGFKQWQTVGRNVKKGEHALKIFAPLTGTKTKINDQTGKEEKLTFIKGFHAIPVFSFESTEGNEIEKANFNPPAPPPLFEVAERYGIKVSYDAFAGRDLGSCRTDGSEITLRAHDADVWFHELAHAVDAHLTEGGQLKGGQIEDQEIVAEMTSGVLCQLYGISGYECQTWEYIRGYSDDSAEKAIKQIFGLLGRVEAIVNDILQVASRDNIEAKETEAA